MNAAKDTQNKTPMLALDAEKWRIKNGLTISLACELLGLQRAKWAAMMQDSSAPIDDMAVCILLELYEEFPETMPIGRVVDIIEYMRELGFDPEDPADKKEFSISHGREAAAAYRWKNNEGNISKPVERIVEAVGRLDTTSGKKRRAVLKSVAEKVARRNGVPNPFKSGTWRSD